MAFVVMSVAITMIIASITTLIIVFKKDSKPKTEKIESSQLRHSAITKARVKRSTRQSQSDHSIQNATIVATTNESAGSNHTENARVHTHSDDNNSSNDTFSGGE